MAYVIAEPCIDVLDVSCVSVCPVDCIHYEEGTDRKLFITGTHPAVRVKPAIPLRYGTKGWDFSWLVARSDGQVERWRCDPYTLQFDRSTHRYDMRWFVLGDS